MADDRAGSYKYCKSTFNNENQLNLHPQYSNILFVEAQKNW